MQITVGFAIAAKVLDVLRVPLMLRQVFHAFALEGDLAKITPNDTTLPVDEDIVIDCVWLRNQGFKIRCQSNDGRIRRRSNDGRSGTFDIFDVIRRIGSASIKGVLSKSPASPAIQSIGVFIPLRFLRIPPTDID